MCSESILNPFSTVSSFILYFHHPGLYNRRSRGERGVRYPLAQLLSGHPMRQASAKLEAITAVLVDGSAQAIKVGMNPSLTVIALAEQATVY